MSQQPMDQIQTNTEPTLTYNGFDINIFPRIIHEGRETYYDDITGPSYTQDNTSREMIVHRIYFDTVEQYNERHRDAMRRYFQPVFDDMQSLQNQYTRSWDRSVRGPPVEPKSSLQRPDPMQEAFVRQNVIFNGERGFVYENMYMRAGLIGGDYRGGFFGNRLPRPRYIYTLQPEQQDDIITIEQENDFNPGVPIYPPEFPPGAGTNLRDAFDRSGSGGL